ncbi:ABC transporter ATP-binding protein [Allobacillus sp. GCM10007491]|uniref:ABC transporter ATP-binding protein n=2 Tax=Allobacillus TaxID=1400133 RepID=A0A941CWN4_9BACI|nr:ABC transporter ATP-binding protein [Allobacillus salarius]MBR7554541.1 ABC transporter ATP-binding protein [Allobacillus saliphilus]TSJ63522.1 ABC transporter ATP-binding protein [Allobacillus salarius]
MILDVQNVHKSYGKEKILKNLSFAIEEPKMVALVGPNGSGKTTLLNIITDLVNADSGVIKIMNLSNKKPEIFKETSYMQDNSVLYDYLTGYDHLQFIGDIQGLSKQQIFLAAERIGMEGYLFKKVSKYSLGMKQHLLLTMAILNDPKLLILDEPLNGLDPSSAIRIRNILWELYNEGKTILLSSHNLSEVDRLTSHILFLKEGHLIAEDLSLNQRTLYEITVNDPRAAEKYLENHNVGVKHMGNNQIAVFMHGDTLQNVLQSLLDNKIKVLDLNKKVTGSEDRYQMVFEQKDV